MGLVKTRRLAAMQKQQKAKAGMKPLVQNCRQVDKRGQKAEVEKKPVWYNFSGGC